MKKQLLVLLMPLSLTTFAQQKQSAQKTNATSSKKVEDGQMKTYYLVFLKKGPKRDQDSASVAKIQEGHMAHLNKMYSEGKMDLAGPMANDGDLRGICIYNVSTIEEAKKLVEMDPAMVSGRLMYEVLPWYSQKGAKLR